MMPTLDERRAYCGLRTITLNGRPAYISGYRDTFARVSLAGSGLGCEWSWATVAHVIKTNKGAFKA